MTNCPECQPSTLTVHGEKTLRTEKSEAIQAFAEQVRENERLAAGLERTQKALDSYMEAYFNMRDFAIAEGLDVTVYHGPTRVTDEQVQP